MKIISKHKDYYDFLQGVNGIDELLVLDRSEFTPTEKYITNDSVFTFYICGYKVQGLYRNGAFLYGESLESLSKQITDYWFTKDKSEKYYRIPRLIGSDYYEILKRPQPCMDFNPNELLNCPLLIQKYSGSLHLKKDDKEISFDKFPSLKEHDLVKVFSAEEIWIMLYNWLIKETPIENKQTDKEKIVSKGFDLKHSFRNTK